LPSPDSAPRIFHLRHARQRGAKPKHPRHFIVFTYDDTTLTILGILHDSMDITQALERREPNNPRATRARRSGESEP
jgi:hypothetical protein